MLNKDIRASLRTDKRLCWCVYGGGGGGAVWGPWGFVGETQCHSPEQMDGFNSIAAVGLNADNPLELEMLCVYANNLL
jgi:hypothetical protein